MGVDFAAFCTQGDVAEPVLFPQGMDRGQERTGMVASLEGVSISIENMILRSAITLCRNYSTSTTGQLV